MYENYFAILEKLFLTAHVTKYRGTPLLRYFRDGISPSGIFISCLSTVGRLVTAKRRPAVFFMRPTNIAGVRLCPRLVRLTPLTTLPTCAAHVQLNSVNIWQTINCNRMPPTIYTVSTQKNRHYVGRNFDKFKQLFIIFGTNHPDNPFDWKIVKNSIKTCTTLRNNDVIVTPLKKAVFGSGSAKKDRQYFGHNFDKFI